MAVFRNILDSGYQGVLYPVNPKARSIQGVKAYPSLADVPDPIDTAVLIVPATMVPEVMEEAAAVGITRGHHHHCRVQGDRRRRGGTGKNEW